MRCGCRNVPVQCVRELIGLPAHWPLLSTTKSLTVDSSVTSPAGVSVLVVLLILVTGRIAYIGQLSVLDFIGGQFLVFYQRERLVQENGE